MPDVDDNCGHHQDALKDNNNDVDAVNGIACVDSDLMKCVIKRIREMVNKFISSVVMAFVTTPLIYSLRSILFECGVQGTILPITHLHETV